MVSGLHSILVWTVWNLLLTTSSTSAFLTRNRACIRRSWNKMAGRSPLIVAVFSLNLNFAGVLSYGPRGASTGEDFSDILLDLVTVPVLKIFFSVAALLSTVAVKYLLESQKEIKNQLTSKKATKTSQPNKNQHDKGELK